VFKARSKFVLSFFDRVETKRRREGKGRGMSLSRLGSVLFRGASLQTSHATLFKTRGIEGFFDSKLRNEDQLKPIRTGLQTSLFSLSSSRCLLLVVFFSLSAALDEEND